MSATKRKANENKYNHWKETEDGGRVYQFEIKGRHNWKARYVKTVDKNENTLSFRQEIYNNENELVEIHEKYPIDKGHKKLRR